MRLFFFFFFGSGSMHMAQTQWVEFGPTNFLELLFSS